LALFTPRAKEAEMTGKLTHEQNQRIINRQENTKGTDAPLSDETLKHAGQRYPKPGPGDAYDISTGDRSIQRGANQESEHHKRQH
jgi:hypothetical protein